MAILPAGSDINGYIAYTIQDLLDQPLFVTKIIHLKLLKQQKHFHHY